jgi:hypothetical protein
MVLSRYESPTAKHNDEIANCTTFSSDLRIHVRSKFRVVSVGFRALVLSMIVDQCSLYMMFLSTKTTQIIGMSVPEYQKVTVSRIEMIQALYSGKLAPAKSWSVSPPRLLLKSNFWLCRSSEKRNTRCVGNFLGPTTDLILSIQTQFRKFEHFLSIQISRISLHDPGWHPKMKSDDSKSWLRNVYWSV